MGTKILSVLWRPCTLVTVEPVLFLFMFCTFLSYPTYQQLLHHTVCTSTANCSDNHKDDNNDSSSNSSCGVSSAIESHVQQETSHWILYTNLASTLPAILVSVPYGVLSDNYGRRFFLVLPALGSVLNSVVVLLVDCFAPSQMYLYLIGAVVCGLGGGYSVFNLAAYSYTADVSCHHTRTPRIGILESMTYFGATLSSAVSGVWISRGGYSSPYWGILALQAVIVLYVTVALPAPGVSRERTFVQGNVNSVASKGVAKITLVFDSAWGTLSVFFKILFKNSSLLLLLLVFLVVEMNFMGINDVVVLYTLSRPLCWSPDVIGYFLAGKVFLNGVAALFVLPLLSHCRVPDAVIVVIGLLSGAVALATMGVASHTWVMAIVPVVGAMRGCVAPCVRAMMSKRTSVHQQGVLFAGICVIETTSSLLASVIYNAIFPVTYRVHPGLCFFVMAAMLLFPLLLILVLMKSSSQHTPSVQEVDETAPLLS